MKQLRKVKSNWKACSSSGLWLERFRCLSSTRSGPVSHGVRGRHQRVCKHWEVKVRCRQLAVMWRTATTETEGHTATVGGTQRAGAWLWLKWEYWPVDTWKYDLVVNTSEGCSDNQSPDDHRQLKQPCVASESTAFTLKADVLCFTTALRSVTAQSHQSKNRTVTMKNQSNWGTAFYHKVRTSVLSPNTHGPTQTHSVFTEVTNGVGVTGS